jgi:CubicO group peptidase (beta-lactamase class C family)
MGSNCKLFTAIVITKLREKGKLGLDDPVVKYLPWFKAKPAGEDDGPITIEQLLSHSSGLQRDAGDVDKDVSGLAVPYGRRMPYGSREVLPFVDARGMAAATGITSDVEDMAKCMSAQFRRGPRGEAQIVLARDAARAFGRGELELRNRYTGGGAVGEVVRFDEENGRPMRM